jgi:hypothetical protein
VIHRLDPLLDLGIERIVVQFAGNYGLVERIPIGAHLTAKPD